MKLLTGLLGGVIAGLIGAAAWAAVVHYTHYELGILAWGIGALVGVGVLIGSGREGGAPLGVLAAAIAIASILGGKWMWVSMSAAGAPDDEHMIAQVADLIVEERRDAGQPVDHLIDFQPNRPFRDDYARDVWAEAERRWNAYPHEEKERLRRLPAFVYHDLHLMRIADDVCAEREGQGEILDWPEGHDVTTAWREAHYPADVWAEAVQRWEAWSPQEQQQYMAWLEQEEAKREREFRQYIRPYAFLYSFSIFDALWFLLAIASAFQIARGGSE